jgi:antirestriction protein
MTLTEVKRCVKVFGRSEVERVLGYYNDEGILLAALDCGIVDVEEVYEGEHDSDEEFVQGMLEDNTPGLEELPTYIHVDWKSTAKDVMMDYCESGGHYFRM